MADYIHLNAARAGREDFAKPLASVAMAAVALGSLFHYVMKGPNEVSKELEDELEKEDAK